MCVLPDGGLLASVAKDRTVRLWRMSDRSQQAVLIGHTDRVERCAFSPDGGLLATTSQDNTVRLWRLPDGNQHAVLPDHTDSVDGCAFSPDGALLATASFDRTVRLWDVADGQSHCALRLGGPLAAVAWHPSGTQICAVGTAGVYLLNYQS